MKDFLSNKWGKTKIFDNYAETSYLHLAIKLLAIIIKMT